MVDIIYFLGEFQEGGSWWALCTLAVFASTLVYGLVYSIAHAFNLEGLKRSSKAEILQAFATLLMVLFLVGTINQVEEFSIDTFLGGKNSFVVCGGSTKTKTDTLNSIIDVVSCRFTQRGQELANLHDNVYEGASGSGNPFTLLSLYISFSGIPIFQGNWVPSWFHEAETYRLLNNFITAVLIGTNAIIALVNYIKLNMLTVFLPFGLFLRTFPYTRGIGALFMSLAIGLYFIFPILFVMTDPGFVEVPEIPKPPATDPQTNFCLPTYSGAVSQAQVTGSVVKSAGTVASLSQSKDAVSQFYIYMTTHAFVVFSITLVFVRYMMFIFGGEAYDLMKFVSKVV